MNDNDDEDATRVLERVEDAARLELSQLLQKQALVHPEPLGGLLFDASAEIQLMALEIAALRDRLRLLRRRMTVVELGQ